MVATPGGAAARGREALRGQLVLGTRPSASVWSHYIKVAVLAILLVALWRSSVGLVLLGALCGDGELGRGHDSHPAIASSDGAGPGREHGAEGKTGDL